MKLLEPFVLLPRHIILKWEAKLKGQSNPWGNVKGMHSLFMCQLGEILPYAVFPTTTDTNQALGCRLLKRCMGGHVQTH